MRVMKRRLKWVVSVGILLVVTAYFGISYLVATGITKAERKEQEDHPSAYGLRYEEVEFLSREEDVNLKGWYLSGKREMPALIFVHGIGSVRTGDNAMELAARLIYLGYNVLLFDLRAHGTSGGDKVSGGIHEQQDVLGAFDYLMSRGISSETIGILGFSMGAATSLLSVLQEPEIQALVADSPYADVSELISQETVRKTPFPGWLVPAFIPTAKLIADKLYGIDVSILVPEQAVTRISYPILVIHGIEDTRIPFDHGVRVYEASSQESKIWLVPGVDHVDAFLTYPDEYVERVDDYLKSRLQPQVR